MKTSVYEQTWFRVLSWAVVVAYMGVIFYVSHLPTLPIPPKFPYQDKLFHFLAYFVLAFTLANAASRGTHKRRFWIAFATASLYGITDEFHQSFVPGRDATVGDWAADTLGAWVGAYLYLKSEGVWRKAPVMKEGQ